MSSFAYQALESLARAITSNLGNLILSGAIAVVAATVYFLSFRQQCRRLDRSLVDALARLRTVESPENFALQFEQLDAWISRHPLLGDAWRAFVGTLLFPKSDERPYAVRCSSHPAEHFNDSSVIATRLNLRFYMAFPNYLTGAGILGTFIGLACGIYLAQAGLTGREIGEVKGALQQLLNGAALAFMTSIVGLISAITFSVAEKRGLHHLSTLIGDWNNVLSERLIRITPEQLAAQHIAESARQSLQLERFNTDLAVTIATALDNQLSARFGPLLERAIAGVEQMVTSRAEVNHAVLQSVVEEFRQALSSQAGSEMGQLQQTFGRLQTNLETAVAALADGQGRLIELTERVTQSLGHSVESHARVLQENVLSAIQQVTVALQDASATAAATLRNSGRDAANPISAAAQDLGRGLAAFASLVTQSHATFDSFRQGTAAMTSLLDQIRETQASFDTAARPIAQGVSALRDAGESIRRATENLTGLAASVKAASDTARQSHDAMSRTWGEYEKRFLQLDAALAKSFGQISNGSAAFADQVKEFVTTVDKEVAEATKLLSGVIDEFKDTLEELRDVLKPLRR